MDEPLQLLITRMITRTLAGDDWATKIRKNCLNRTLRYNDLLVAKHTLDSLDIQSSRLNHTIDTWWDEPTDEDEAEEK